MGNGSGLSRGDRNRNARLARLRALVPDANAIVGVDLADAKQMVVVCDQAVRRAVGGAVTVCRLAGPGRRRSCVASRAATDAGRTACTGVKVRGNLHGLNTAMSVRRAAQPTGQLVADLREHAGSRMVPAVSSHRNVLFDVLVHGQDIAIPLGLDLPMPADAAGEGASASGRWDGRSGPNAGCAASGSPPPALDWTVGSGPDVAGPIRRCSCYSRAAPLPLPRS